MDDCFELDVLVAAVVADVQYGLAFDVLAKILKETKDKRIKSFSGLKFPSHNVLVSFVLAAAVILTNWTALWRYLKNSD